MPQVELTSRQSHLEYARTELNATLFTIRETYLKHLRHRSRRYGDRVQTVIVKLEMLVEDLESQINAELAEARDKAEGYD